MGKKQRRTFSAEFKLDTVMEGLRGDKSISTICREHGITSQALGNLPQQFPANAG